MIFGTDPILGPCYPSSYNWLIDSTFLSRSTVCTGDIFCRKRTNGGGHIRKIQCRGVFTLISQLWLFPHITRILPSQRAQLLQFTLCGVLIIVIQLVSKCGTHLLILLGHHQRVGNGKLILGYCEKLSWANKFDEKFYCCYIMNSVLICRIFHISGACRCLGLPSDASSSWSLYLSPSKYFLIMQ